MIREAVLPELHVRSNMMGDNVTDRIDHIAVFRDHELSRLVRTMVIHTVLQVQKGNKEVL